MRARTSLLWAIALVLLCGGASPAASARIAGAPLPPGSATQKPLSKEEALALAFPKCDVRRSTVYLSKEQRAAVEKLAGVKLEKGVVFPYVAKNEGKLVGTAWFDVHKVRTKREALMFVVDPEHKLRRLEILAFGEPKEYLPRASWYAQFLGKELGPELRVGRSIKGVTGATLTARATTDAARRVLALHRIVFPPKPEPE